MPVVCPRCRAEIEPLPIVYGYPTHATFLEAEAGRVSLGGCMVGPESPEFECPECEATIPLPARLSGAIWGHLAGTDDAP